MLVAVGEKEEAPHLHVMAALQQRFEPGGAEVRQASHELVDLLKAFAARQLVEQFENTVLRRREDDRSI